MQIDIDAASTGLSSLVHRAHAGEEVVITLDGRPVARLMPVSATKPERKLGLLEGQDYWIADDFDTPLPGDMLDLFEGNSPS
jgi:prevent-host-death family protein